ncbi:MAG TPA: hypothetical protein VGB16_01630, partial [candidate division Zixibacteria bacterium]
MKVPLRYIMWGVLFLFFFGQSSWAKSIGSASKSQKVINHEKLEAAEEYLNSKTLSGEFGPHGSYGGPNSYNYHWVDSDTNLGITYGWIEISGGGTLINTSEWHNSIAPAIRLDDGTAGPYYLGFSFPYCDSTYDSIYVGTNGVLSFSDSELTDSGYFNYDYYCNGITIPYMRFPNAISPLYVDMNLDPATNHGGGYVYYWKNAAGDTFIVEYKDVRPYAYDYSPNDSATLEVIFATIDTSITFQYKHIEFHDSLGYNPQGFDFNERSLVGIQDGSRKIGLRYHSGFQNWWRYEGMNNSPHNGLAVKFKRDEIIQHNLTSVYYKQGASTYEPYNWVYYYSWDLDKTYDIESSWFFNTGKYDEIGVPVSCDIYAMDTAGNAVSFVQGFNTTLSDIGAHDSAQAVFSGNWQPPARGRYKVIYKANLPGDELSFDDSLNRNAYAERKTMSSNWANIVPVCDGHIEALEWGDAFKQDISYFKEGDGMLSTPPYSDSNAVFLYVKNDSNFIYLAVDAKADTTDTRTDRVKIVIDDNTNGFFEADSSEGFLMFWNYPSLEDSLFFTEEVSQNNPPYYYGMPRDTYTVSGVDYGFSKNGSNMQVEMAIPFGDEHWKINKTSLDSVGICVYYMDWGDSIYFQGSPSGLWMPHVIGSWPWYSMSHYYPGYLGRIVLNSTTDVGDE